jgi:hypothetical protein
MSIGRDSAARAFQSICSCRASTSLIPGITSAAKLLFRRRRHDLENTFFAPLRLIRPLAACAHSSTMQRLPALTANNANEREPAAKKRNDIEQISIHLKPELQCSVSELILFSEKQFLQNKPFETRRGLAFRSQGGIKDTYYVHSLCKNVSGQQPTVAPM